MVLKKALPDKKVWVSVQVEVTEPHGERGEDARPLGLVWSVGGKVPLGSLKHQPGTEGFEGPVFGCQVGQRGGEDGAVGALDAVVADGEQGVDDSVKVKVDKRHL